MFESNITAQSLVNAMKEDIDVAPDIPEDYYYKWIDETEQLLYSEIIRELAIYSATNPPVPVIPENMVQAGADNPRFEDIYAVYADKTQLIKTSAVTGPTFPDTYWKQNNNLYYNTRNTPETLKVYYFIRPSLKQNTHTHTIKLPVEWVSVIRAKLRGEAYRLVNEDSVAAKWLNEYNISLEMLRQYIAAKASEFGV